LAVGFVVLGVAFLRLARRTSRIDARLGGLTRGEGGSSLESILDAHLDKVFTVSRDLALLDGAGDGWVMSSLHARSGTRVYAKAIKAGRAETALSEEESAAIREAMV